MNIKELFKLSLPVPLIALTVLVAAPLSVSAESAQEGSSLTLIVTSGLSGRLVDGERTAAEVARATEEMADEARAEGRRVLVLDAGHTFLPYAESRFDDGATMAAILAAAGHRAVLPSQMDFSLGRDAIDRLGRSAEIPLIAPLATKDPGGLAEGTRLDVDGLTLDLFSTVDRAAAEHMAAVGFESPAATEALKLAEPQGDGAADLRLAVIHGHGAGSSLKDRDQLWELLDDPQGFDIFLVPDLGHDMVIERLGNEHPVIVVGRRLDRPNPWQVARVDIELERREGRLQPTGARLAVRRLARDETTETGAARGRDARGRDARGRDAPNQDLEATVRRTMEAFRRASDTRLPPNRPQTRDELVQFALLAVRDAAKAEVAIVNQEVFRPVDGRYFEPGAVTVETVRRLLSIDQYLETGRLLGEEIEALLQDSLSRTSGGARRLDDSLRFAGLTYELDDDGRATKIEINGHSLYPQDAYRVVTTAFLSAGGDGYGPLTDMQGKQLTRGDTEDPLEFRDDVVLPHLLSSGEVPFTDLASKGLWRFGLDRLHLGVNGVRHDADEAYDDSADSRASAEESLNLQFAADLRADQEWQKLRWENRLHVRFALLEEGDEEQTEQDDDVRFESTALWDPFPDSRRFLNGAAPFAGLIYESELRTEDDIPRRDVRSLTAGLNWSFELWPRVRIGALARTREDVESADRFGLFGELHLEKPAVGHLPALSGRLLVERVENSDAAISRLDFELQTAVPLGERLELRPAYNFYLYEDSRLPGRARYQRFSLGLSYRWTGKLQRR